MRVPNWKGIDVWVIDESLDRSFRDWGCSDSVQSSIAFLPPADWEKPAFIQPVVSGHAWGTFLRSIRTMCAEHSCNEQYTSEPGNYAPWRPLKAHQPPARI